MSGTQLSHQSQIYQVYDRKALLDAISNAVSGDTILFTKEGDYGHVSIINKSGLLIKSKTKQLVIQASLSIDGLSSKIIIENLNLWNDNPKKRQVLITGKQSSEIIIRHCIFSSFPVSMNTSQAKFSGEPKNWINGIRLLGLKCEVINNIIVNVKLGIQSSGIDTNIQDNVIQYFSKDAIRVSQHNIEVSNNHIYDLIRGHSGETRSRDGILLTPPESRYNAGELRDVKIRGNIVRSQSKHTTVPKHMQGILRGITAAEGYFIDIIINDNSLVVNSNDGITLNGAQRLEISANKVIRSPSHRQCTPGIKLYLTRISTTGANHYKWLMDKSYSVNFSNNQAPEFNVPTDAYKAFDLGHNHFTHLTHHLTSEYKPVISETQVSEQAQTNVATLPPPLLNSKLSSKQKEEIVPEKVLNKPVLTPPKLPTIKNKASGSLAPILHRVANAQELSDAIVSANEGDTILISRAGNYGHIHITDKTKLRIKSFSVDIPLQVSFVIDGSSRLILLENMQLWNDNLNRQTIIHSGKTTSHILIRHCILSTVALNRNTLHKGYSGDPQQWINGIRMLGSNGQIVSNFMMNLKTAILESGSNTLIQHNLIKFYSEDGIRVNHHDIKVLHNHIYDSIAAHPGQSTHKNAIQLVPPQNHNNAGKLMNVQIIGNIIQSFTYPAVVPTNQQGIVRGIFGREGYFTNAIIKGNTVMVNSDHGITLNGVLNLKLHNNKVIDLTEGDHFQPGIKLYLTQVSQYGQQKWLANRSYSVHMNCNQAPVLNIPSEAYSIQGMRGNQYTDTTQQLAQGQNPVIIRREGSHEVVGTISDDNKTADNIPVLTASVSAISTGVGGTGISVFSVTNKDELDRATRVACSGDTILFKKAGDYGQIRLTNKKDICIRAVNRKILINGHFLIDGCSKNITLENINLWFTERNWKPVILTAPNTTHITIRNCVISSYPVTKNQVRNKMVGIPKNWTSGIWLRGHANKVSNNHIVNVRTGIIASGGNTLIQNNLIQYFSQTGIRLMSDNMEVDHNNIYDAINQQPEKQHLTTGIQLIPAKDRFNGGSIKNIKVSYNIIQEKNSGSPTIENMQSQLQGITMHDGYASNVMINSNTIIVNTEHGITINGASGLSLNSNQVFDSKLKDPYTPGIKIYYTRSIDLQGNQKRQWHSELHYSVSYSDNKSAVFNIPNSGYEINDGGGNEFTTLTHDKGRGFNPVFTL